MPISLFNPQGGLNLFGGTSNPRTPGSDTYQYFNAPGTQNFGKNSILNRYLAEGTGYTGDFGTGGWQNWIDQQSPELQAKAQTIGAGVTGYYGTPENNWTPAAPATTPAAPPATTAPANTQTNAAPSFGNNPSNRWYTLGAGGDIANTIIADEDFMRRNYAGQYRPEQNFGKSTGLNREMSLATNYTGDFGSGGWQNWLNQQPATTQAAGQLAASNYLDPAQNFGANPDVNKQIATLTNYTGDFGTGGFDRWLRANPGKASTPGLTPLLASRGPGVMSGGTVPTTGGGGAAGGGGGTTGGTTYLWNGGTYTSIAALRKALEDNYRITSGGLDPNQPEVQASIDAYLANPASGGITVIPG